MSTETGITADAKPLCPEWMTAGTKSRKKKNLHRDQSEGSGAGGAFGSGARQKHPHSSTGTSSSTGFGRDGNASAHHGGYSGGGGKSRSAASHAPLSGPLDHDDDDDDDDLSSPFMSLGSHSHSSSSSAFASHDSHHRPSSLRSSLDRGPSAPGEDHHHHHHHHPHHHHHQQQHHHHHPSPSSSSPSSTATGFFDSNALSAEGDHGERSHHRPSSDRFAHTIERSHFSSERHHSSGTGDRLVGRNSAERFGSNSSRVPSSGRSYPQDRSHGAYDRSSLADRVFDAPGSSSRGGSGAGRAYRPPGAGSASHGSHRHATDFFDGADSGFDDSGHSHPRSSSSGQSSGRGRSLIATDPADLQDFDDHDDKASGKWSSRDAADNSDGPWNRVKRPFTYSKKELLSFFQPLEAIPSDFLVSCGIFSRECLLPVAQTDTSQLARTTSAFTPVRGRTRGRIARGRGAPIGAETGSRFGDNKWVPGKEQEPAWRPVEEGDAADDDFSAYGGDYSTPSAASTTSATNTTAADREDDHHESLEEDQALEPEREKVAEHSAAPLVDEWYYIDPKMNERGPFTTAQMRTWHRQFPPNLTLKRGKDGQFHKLSELGNDPFVLPTVLPSVRPAADLTAAALTAAALTPASSTPSSTPKPLGDMDILGSWLKEVPFTSPSPAATEDRPSLLERLNLTSTPSSSSTTTTTTSSSASSTASTPSPTSSSSTPSSTSVPVPAPSTSSAPSPSSLELNNAAVTTPVTGIPVQLIESSSPLDNTTASLTPSVIDASAAASQLSELSVTDPAVVSAARGSSAIQMSVFSGPGSPAASAAAAAHALHPASGYPHPAAAGQIPPHAAAAAGQVPHPAASRHVGYAPHPYQVFHGMQALLSKLAADIHRLRGELLQSRDEYEREQKIAQLETLSHQYNVTQSRLHAFHIQVQQYNQMMMQVDPHSAQPQAQQPAATAPTGTHKGTFNLEDIEGQLAASSPATGASPPASASTAAAATAGHQAATPAPWLNKVMTAAAPPSFKSIQKSELSNTAPLKPAQPHSEVPAAATAAATAPAATAAPLSAVVPGREVPSVDQLQHGGFARTAAASTPAPSSTPAQNTTSTQSVALSEKTNPSPKATAVSPARTSQQAASPWALPEAAKPLSLLEIQKQQAKEIGATAPAPVDPQSEASSAWAILEAQLFSSPAPAAAAEQAASPPAPEPAVAAAPKESKKQQPAKQQPASAWNTSDTSKVASFAEIQQQEARAARQREAAKPAPVEQPARASSWATSGSAAVPTLREIQAQEKELKKQAAQQQAKQLSLQEIMRQEELEAKARAKAKQAEQAKQAKQPSLQEIMRQEELEAKARAKARAGPPVATVSLATPWTKPGAAPTETDDFWGTSKPAPAPVIEDFPALGPAKKAATDFPALAAGKKAKSPAPAPASAPAPRTEAPAKAPAAAKPAASDFPALGGAAKKGAAKQQAAPAKPPAAAQAKQPAATPAKPATQAKPAAQAKPAPATAPAKAAQPAAQPKPKPAASPAAGKKKRGQKIDPASLGLIFHPSTPTNPSLDPL